VNKIVEWAPMGHYMVCKICKTIFVPTCFERIEEHVKGPKHAQNFQKQQLDNVP
jgi:hypothetical protein